MRKVSINPGIGILTVIKSLNYKPWFALAEFIDNSISSYQNNKKELEEINGKNFKLDIQINFSIDRTITITDNAAGIHDNDFDRALKPAELPPDRNGLNEFGMGMKSAALWFTDEWEIRTSALGEDVERTVIFNQKKVQKEKIEDLEVIEQSAQKNYHKTEIILRNVEKWPIGQTRKKIVSHLSSIYRKLIQSKKIQIFIDDEEVRYFEPEILEAPYWGGGPNCPAPTGEKIIKWELNDIKIDLGDKKQVEGKVYIRKTGSTRTNGMSYFRRGRLIIGSDEDVYRPVNIYGSGNTYKKQRLNCEFTLKNFAVTHTKDGIQWGENLEELFFEKLLKILKNSKIDGESVDFLKQCEGYRARNQSYEDAGQQAIEDFVQEDSKRFAAVKINTEKVEEQKDNIEEFDLTIEDKKTDIPYTVTVGGDKWVVLVKIDWNETGGINWFAVTREHKMNEEQPYKMGVKLNMKHTFFLNFLNASGSEALKPIIRIIVGFVVAEALVKSTGNNQILIRRKMIEIVNSVSEQRT